MDVRKYLGRSFIKVDDVRDCSLQLQIADVKEGKFDKLDVSFETSETLSLNATNTKILVHAYGPNSDGWIGKQIELTLGTVRFQNKPQETVIVKPISPSIATADRTPAPKADVFNDDIPY
jgi:hypothetical protein